MLSRPRTPPPSQSLKISGFVVFVLLQVKEGRRGENPIENPPLALPRRTFANRQRNRVLEFRRPNAWCVQFMWSVCLMCVSCLMSHMWIKEGPTVCLPWSHRVLNPWDDDMFQCIDTTISNLDSFIKLDERSLHRRRQSQYGEMIANTVSSSAIRTVIVVLSLSEIYQTVLRPSR